MSEFNKTSPNSFGKVDVWNVDVPVKDDPQGHCVITQNFVDAILDGAELIAPAAEGINSVEFANAMLYSTMTGAEVEVPLDGAAYEAKLKELIASSKFEKKVSEGGAEQDMSASFR